MKLQESFHCLSPQLPVEDLGRSLDFYVGQLGFCLNFRAEDSYAGVGLEGLSTTALHLLATTGGGERVVVVIGTTDVDGLFAEWQAGGVAIEQPITETVAGREFRVRDPDGHMLSIFDVTGG